MIKNILSQSVQSGSGLISISYLKPDPFPLICLMQFIAVRIQTLANVPVLNHSDYWCEQVNKGVEKTNFLDDYTHTNSWNEIKSNT